MWTAICLILGFISLLAVVVFLAKNWGENKVQTEMKKYELERMVKEQARANKIIDNVRNMSYNDVRKRLQNRKRN